MRGSIPIYTIAVVTISVLFTVTAPAQESPAEKPPAAEEGPTLETWLSEQPELVKAVDEAKARMAKRAQKYTPEKLDAAAKQLYEWLMEHAEATDDEPEWPVTQLDWVRERRAYLDKREKQHHTDGDYLLSAHLLDDLNRTLTKTAKDMGKLEEPKESVAEEEDPEHVWRYRGLRGQRTTQPRYKGQEPAN